MLRRFVLDADKFLDIMATTEAVISGSFALNYMEGDPGWSAADLDVYVPFDHWDTMCRHFIEVEGYAPDEELDRHQAETRQRAIANQLANLLTMWTVDNVHEDDEGLAVDDEGDTDDWAYAPLFVESGIRSVRRLFCTGRKVDVIQVKSSCALFALTRFWSTLQMNYLSARGFACAYPLTTFIGVGILSTLVLDHESNPRKPFVKAIVKYGDRGYTFITQSVPLGEPCSHQTASCATLRRGFNDDKCFTVTFDTSETPYQIGGCVTPSSVHKVGWKLGGGLHGTENVISTNSRTFNAITGGH